MARTSIEIDAPMLHVWDRLQVLATWEDVAGIHSLHSGELDEVGNLTKFAFEMHTGLGSIDGRARVWSTITERRNMSIYADQKGLRINLVVSLGELENERTNAHIDVQAEASSFLTKPLEFTVNQVLDHSIEDEAAKIAGRVVKENGEDLQ